jgi:hypothetical protein
MRVEASQRVPSRTAGARHRLVGATARRWPSQSELGGESRDERVPKRPDACSPIEAPRRGSRSQLAAASDRCSTPVTLPLRRRTGSEYHCSVGLTAARSPRRTSCCETAAYGQNQPRDRHPSDARAEAKASLDPPEPVMRSIDAKQVRRAERSWWSRGAGCCAPRGSGSSLGGEIGDWPTVVGRSPAHPIWMMTLLGKLFGFGHIWLVLSPSAGFVLSAAGIVEWRWRIRGRSGR